MLGVTTDPAAIAFIVGLAAALGAIAVAVVAQQRARAAAALLERAAEHDRLTDLPNRAMARDELDRLLRSTSFGFVVLELDRFAEVNESYGHEVGDRLLGSMAEQLEQLVTSPELLARWGGPQFALLLPDARTSDEVAARATTLQDALSAKVRIGHDTLRVTASCGGVIADGERFPDGDAVVDAAMTALEIARTDGRGGTRTFDRTMTMPVTTATAGDRLRAAIDQGQLWVLWEPVVSMTDRRIAGVEAVTHWADPQRGVLPPAEFAELLRRAGLEALVAEHALEQALAQAGRWHERRPDLVVMVTTPPSLLRDEALLPRLEGLLAESGADPHEVCVQVAGQSRTDIYDLWAVMRQIKDLGLQVALDDFGIGWSSLAYLRRFSVDVLKLPGEFVGASTASTTDQAVTQQIVGLANALGMAPVAEGVASREEADLLVSLGCELGQGPLYGQAMTLDSFEAALERGKVEPRAAQGAGIDWTATSS